MVVVAVSDPEVAVIVADPFATAVIRPEELTVATAASDVDHVTACPVIAALFWFFTVDVN